MEISVVIPSYNRKFLLERCINSVTTQTFQPAEIILIDDGSTDETASWVHRMFPTVSVFRQENAGVSSARNLGIAKSKSPWVAFLDSDDVWLTPKLEKQMKALISNPDSLFCHTEEHWYYEGATRAMPKAYRKKEGWIFEHCLPRCAISPSTVVIHQSVFDKAGLFDETLPACEDYDLWLRICSKMPVQLVDEPLIEKHGGHPDQLSNQRELDRYRIQALVRFLKSNEILREHRLMAEDQLRKKCEVYAKGLKKHGRVTEADYYLRVRDSV